jgi:hypothetical protein
LGLREIYSPARQSSLLQDPTALVERALDDISTKVIDGLANVETFLLLALHRDKLALPSVLKKAVVLMYRTAGSQHAIGSAKNCLHILGLLSKIPILALDNAYRIYL